MAIPAFLLFPFGLTKEDAKIGRFVSDPFAPQNCYYPEEPSVPNNLLSRKDHTNAKTVLNTFEMHQIKANLMSLFEAKCEKSSHANATLETSTLHTMLLRNPGTQLNQLLQDLSTREWIRKNRNRPLYLITGIKTFEAATVSVKCDSKTEGRVGATATAFALDLTAVMKETTLQTSFDVPGDTIFAVQYQELKKVKGIIGKHRFDGASLGPAELPRGGHGMFYGVEEETSALGSKVESQDCRPEAAGDEDMNYELLTEYFTPTEADGDFVAEDSEEIQEEWFMKIAKEKEENA